MVGTPPQSWSEVWALTPHIVYSWVQQTPLAWQPEGTPSGGLRVELTIHNSTGVSGSKSAMLSYIDGAASLTRYVGDEEQGTGRWARLVTATPPQEFDLPLAEGLTALHSSTYRKDQFSVVTVGGAISGDMIIGKGIATLPAGFRPSEVIERDATFISSMGRVAGSIQVNLSGEITLNNDTNSTAVFFELSFISS